MPRWKELKRFCDRDGWELYKEIHTKMWQTILKKQLQVTQEYFNSVI